MNNFPSVAAQAATVSLNAAHAAFTPSPLNPFSVAYAVGMEAAERARRDAVRADLNERRAKHAEGRTPRLLGCWVNGKLRYQSRDHESVHGYAREHMQGQANRTVWVAPVGSFIDAETANKADSAKVRRVRKAK